MYIPKKLDVRGTTWIINHVEQPVGDDGELANGTCEPIARVIELKKDLPPLLMLEVFFHEWVHAEWFEAGIDDELPDQHKWVEHMIIAAVSKDLVNKRKIFAKVLASYK